MCLLIRSTSKQLSVGSWLKCGVKGQRSPSLSAAVCWVLPAVFLWPCPAPSSSPLPYGPTQQKQQQDNKNNQPPRQHLKVPLPSSVGVSFSVMKCHISLTISEWKAICLARPMLSQIWNTWRRQTGQTNRALDSKTNRWTHRRPSRHRCWTQRCSRWLGCRPARPPSAERNQTASCCPDGTNTEPHWREGTTGGVRRSEEESRRRKEMINH